MELYSQTHALFSPQRFVDTEHRICLNSEPYAEYARWASKFSEYADTPSLWKSCWYNIEFIMKVPRFKAPLPNARQHGDQMYFYRVISRLFQVLKDR